MAYRPRDRSEFSVIWGIHLFGGKVYDYPQLQGGFVNLDYFEDALLVQGFSDGQATGAAIRQNGNVYVAQMGTGRPSLGPPSRVSGYRRRVSCAS